MIMGFRISTRIKYTKHTSQKLAARSFCVLVACKIAEGIVAHTIAARSCPRFEAFNSPAINDTPMIEPNMLNHWTKFANRSLLERI